MRPYMMPLLVGLVIAIACDDSTSAVPATPFIGVFTLQTVEGSGLPVTLVQSGNSSVSLLADQLTIADGGTWSEQFTRKVVTNGQLGTQAGVDSGTWLQKGSTLTLFSRLNNDIPYNGTFAGNALTLDIPEGSTFLFVK